MENIMTVKNKNANGDLYDPELAEAATELFALLDEANACKITYTREEANEILRIHRETLNGKAHN